MALSYYLVSPSGVCHERLRPIKRCYSKDEGRSLEIACQKEISNRPVLLRPQVRGGKRVGKVAREYRAWVRIEEMSASEPLMTYRKGHNVVETGVAPNLRDKSAGCLILCRRQPVL